MMTLEDMRYQYENKRPPIYLLLNLLWWAIQEYRFWTALNYKLDCISLQKIANAESLYKPRVEAWLAAIECEEAHISGDCPLCGAE